MQNVMLNDSISTQEIVKAVVRYMKVTTYAHLSSSNFDY